MSAIKTTDMMFFITKGLMTILLVTLLSLAIPMGIFSAGAADGIEGPMNCKQCGMDRSVFDRGRMLIIYADGTTVGVCSLHCAAAELRQNKGRQVKSLLVADYATRELIDAKTAFWVMGGRIQGAMTSLPKWAFAREKDAKQFVMENGGDIANFADAMKSAEEEIGEEAATTHTHTHAGHDMGPGAQMLFNPAMGDQIYHTHPAGMWMFDVKYMHTNMSGLRDGTTNVSLGQVIPMNGTRYGYMMTPTGMTMDMYMLMGMYGITDKLTAMVMGTYQVNEMNMVMNMGMGNFPQSPMRTSGIGDTELRGIYKINEYLVGSLGLSLPTGSTHQEFETMGMNFRAPYDMQLGSGTFDLKPALTYNALSDDAKWNWGAQAAFTYHMGRNEDGYSLGSILNVTSWLQRALGPATTWIRLAYNDTGRIRGQDPEIQQLLDPTMGVPTPDADPSNYGGQSLNGFIGVSFLKGPFSIGVEGGIPLYQDLNGLQLKTKWFITAAIQIML